MASDSKMSYKIEENFKNLSAEDDVPEVTEIESLCMNCHENGMTRLMLTKIPFFKEVIISSFTCDDCGFENREIQLGGKIQDRGIKYILNVKEPEDMNRQFVRSDCALFTIPSLEFEHPGNKKAEITTLEGIITGAISGLKKEQPLRYEMDENTAQKIDKFIEKLEELLKVETPFDVELDDPTGNSFIQNPHAPKKDEALNIQRYIRTRKQDIEIGVIVEGDETEDTENIEKPEDSKELNLENEVLTFPGNCPHCNIPCDTNMKIIDVPFFKQVVIMATNCDSCGMRENEVKSGSGIADKGTRIKLHMKNTLDLSRDLLKSDTCGLEIPELELVLEHGTLGGRFSTVEGILNRIKDQLSNTNPFFAGDSAGQDDKSKLVQFCEKLDEVIRGDNLNVTLILDDPAGNSYMQSLCAPDPDPQLEVIHYERDHEHKEMLGLNDMKTENYEEDDNDDDGDDEQNS